MASNTTDDTLKEIAWASVAAALPKNMSPMITVMGIQKFPSAVQLKRIDDIFDETKQPTVNAVSHQCSSSSLESRLTKLEQNVEKLLKLQESNNQPTSHSNLGSNFSHRNNGHYFNNSNNFPARRPYNNGQFLRNYNYRGRNNYNNNQYRGNYYSGHLND